MKHAHLLLVSLLLFAMAATACAQGPDSDSLSPPEQHFEELWQAFHESYALFEVKGVDWDALYELYRPRVSAETTEEELFAVLSAMLGHLNDNHVILRAISLERDFSAGLLGQLISDKGMSDAMAMLGMRPLPPHYFQGEPALIGGDVFQYGWVDEGIGYVHFGGFGDPEGSGAAMDAILASFQGARGLIVDVRRNRGGNDSVGKAIADRFADQRRLYMTTSKRLGPGPEDFASPRYWHVDPVAGAYTGPVILLQNRLSLSAAENFALAMRVLPHVTVVGDFSSGCFADMRWLELPNGWKYSLSYNLFQDHAGRCWEGIGVPPDIMVRGFDIATETDEAFEVALDLLRMGGPALQDEQASALAARHSLVEKLVQDFQTGGFDHARREFNQVRQDLDASRYYLAADELNMLGYELLGAEQHQEAVAVFTLYVESFPTDANAHDSLGEAYLASGDRERAIAEYERALELSPGFPSAVKMLEQLRQGE